MQATLPHLTCSALHRCLPRHGINRLPEMDGATPAKKRFTAYPIGSFHLDIAAVRTAEGTLSLLVASDRTCTCTSAALHEEANTMVAAQFLHHLVAIVPDEIHSVRTDHGMQFTTRQRERYAVQQIFERGCQECGIEHRLTHTNHPWTNGQVERMNRTRKDATVKTAHAQTHHHLKRHRQAFLMADHFAKRLKTLKGLTPDEYICECWPKDPQRCPVNPDHHTLGLNTLYDLILEEELGIREGRRFKQALKLTGLPSQKTLDGFDCAFQPDLDVVRIKELATLRFVEQKANAIFLGPPGTGKTYVAVALAIAACQRESRLTARPWMTSSGSSRQRSIAISSNTSSRPL